MATQAYMPRDSEKKKVDVTKLAQTLAPGHPPELQPKSGAENRTPAPTRDPYSTFENAKSTSWGRAGKGAINEKNASAMGYGGPSSINPSEKAGPATIDPHGPAGADPVLKNLAMGTARAIDQNDDWQTRKLNSTGSAPYADGMRPRTSDGTVPAKLGGGSLSDAVARARGGK